MFMDDNTEKNCRIVNVSERYGISDMEAIGKAIAAHEANLRNGQEGS